MHRRSLATCIVSVKNILNIFLGLDTETLAAMPTFTFARTGYAVFFMIKIYFAACSSPPSATNSGYTPLFSRSNDYLNAMLHPFNSDSDDDGLDVDFYLDAILKSLGRVTEAKTVHMAGVIRLVLIMLRTWFWKQKEQMREAEKGDSSEEEVPRMMGAGVANWMHRGDDSVLQTGLERAEGTGEEKRAQMEGNGLQEDHTQLQHATTIIPNVATLDSGISMATPEYDNEGTVGVDGDGWMAGFEGDGLAWGGIDFTSLFEGDDRMWMQIAMERLGGLIG
jgi:hypothetical protein